MGSELTKHNPFLNDCPYWLGTREKVENGIRYIYETSQGKTHDGYDFINFKKKKENGIVIEELTYEIRDGGPVEVNEQE